MANQNEKTNSNAKAWIKEKIRKFLVSLKRNPQYIPLCALTLSFFVFSLNLTDISNTTAKIMGPHMGLASFVTMLFSILSYVCMFGAFPKRKKPNLVMIILMFVMYAVVLFADYHYLGCITNALTRANNPIVVTPALQYIYNAQYYLTIHMVTVGITIACVILEPVFAKLLSKINTSVEVEGNGNIGTIDIGSDD